MRRLITIYGDTCRARAIEWIKRSARGARLEFKDEVRTLDQNSKMWAMLTEIAEQVDWYGQKLAPEDWKDIFTAGLRAERVVPDLDGTGFVRLGLHTSDMSKREMSDLFELMRKFGAEHAVVFSDDDDQERAA